MKSIIKTLSISLIVLLLGTALWGQGSGELNGLVTDPSGAAIPKLTLKLTNSATGAVRTTETSAAGTYTFPALPVVGRYTLTIEANGFRTARIENIAVSVGTKVTRDVQMAVGRVSEVVSVEGSVQAVQTAESQVSSLIDERVWQQMPLETRNQNEFINLVAGVAPDTYNTSTRGSSVNGTRGGSGNFLVEGADNNDQGQGGRGQISDSKGGAITGVSPDAIQEYRVITNSFAAEYGKAGGFVTDTVLKSGTNSYHGSLFEYNRVQALAANSFFSNRKIDPETGKTLKDALVRNQFGGSFGGPIVKNKTFFFTSFEMNKRRDRNPTTTTNTTQEFLNFVQSGQFATFMESDPNGYCLVNLGSACPGGFAGASTLGPIFQRLKAKGPFPLGTSNYSYEGASLYTGGLVYPVPVYGDATVRDGYQVDQYRWSFKFDQKLTDKDQLSVSYLLDDGKQTWLYGGGDGTIGPPSISPGRSQNAVVSWNHTFSPTMMNVFKASYLRHVTGYPNAKGYETMPSVQTAFDPIGVSFGMSSAMPQAFTDNQFEFQDHFTFVKGKHNFKTGMEYRRLRNGSSFNMAMNGYFLPYGVEDLVTDMLFGDLVDQLSGDSYGSLYFAQASVNPLTGTRPDYYRGYRANEYAAYFQDDFRVNRRLTLNYGVRWEYSGPPHNYKAGLDSNFYFGSTSTPIATSSTNPYFPVNSPFYAAIANGSFQQRDRGLWNRDTNNFAPRFGFAYDVLGNQKLALRGGFGVMYDRIWNNLFENIRFNYPSFSAATIGAYGNGMVAGALSTPGLYSDNFTTANTAMFNNPAYAPKPSPRHMDQNLVTPYYEQFHLGLQYEVAQGYILSTEYIGTMGHKLTALIDANTFNGRMVDSRQRPNTNIASDNFRTNAFSSNYHGLQVAFKKNFGKGLQFDSSYTWSKAMDYMSDAFNSRTGDYPTDNMNRRLDYGPADFDVRHRFVTSFSYELPFMKQNRWLGNWSVNGIVTVQSGQPFSPYDSNTDTNADGHTDDRITYIGAGRNPNQSVKLQKSVTDSTNVGYFDAASWADPICPASVNGGAWCNGGWGRNSITGPGYFNTDLGITKRFKLNERFNMSFMGNLFNVFNRANFGLPTFDLASGRFGQISSTVGNARVTQLALRLDF